MRTLTVRKGSGTNYTTVWHTLTISNAKYGDYNGSKFLDVLTTNRQKILESETKKCSAKNSGIILLLLICLFSFCIFKAIQRGRYRLFFDYFLARQIHKRKYSAR